MTGRLADTRIRADDLTREQRKADSDVEQVRTRRTRDQDRMDSGQVTNPKDLEHLQHELVALNRRISALEDVELEVMEQLETAQTEQRELEDVVAGLEARSADLVESRDRSAGVLQQELEQLEEQRGTTVTDVSEPLLKLYDRLRTNKGGVGAAALRQRRCTGCSLQLNASDLGIIAAAPADEVLRCEECDRILVRTVDSGV